MSAAVAGASPESRRRRNRGVDGDRAAGSPDDEAVGKIKVESDADIKDYAETTMNELLGWYGYDKLDTRGLNLKNLNHHFPTSSSSSSPLRHEEDISEEDTGRSRSPHLENEPIALNPSGATITCAWCLKTGMKLFTLKTSAGEVKAFCSEPCFNQCRRAAFKKNRVCNWCRHVRHTVNYVDFQDGDDQLQFCSDKCLNQYKMQIFCKETQAYLQMNPHLQEETNRNTGGANSKLITPDLWLRDCQEPINGGGSQNSDDEVSLTNTGMFSGKSKNCEELEDLSLSSKQERCSLTGGNPTSLLEREITKSEDLSVKEKRPIEMCNTLASYLREDVDKNFSERKKRFHESEKEHARKRQRISSLRNKISQHAETSAAHHSSAHSPISFQNQNRIFPSSASPYPPQLSASSPAPLNPPAAHSNSIPPHPALAGTILPPNLPPPPPLLNNDFLPAPFNPSLFPPPLSLSQQQQFDAILRMQSGIRPNTTFSPHLFYESMLPLLRGSAPSTSSPFFQPNTVMFPCPVFVPLPVPIPIPIPLPGLLSKDKNPAKPASSEKEGGPQKPPAPADSESVCAASDSEKQTKLKNSKHEATRNAINDTKQEQLSNTSSYAVTNNDNQTHRLILTRNRTK